MRILNFACVGVLAFAALSGCEKRQRTKNSSGSSSLFEEGTTQTTNVYRFVGVEQSLTDARKAVKEESWGDAIAATDALLKNQPNNVEAKAINQQAKLELPNQQRFNDFAKAAAANELAAAIRHYRQIADNSAYRERARPIFDRVSVTFVENQIADTRALNRAGRCDDARRVARVTSEWFPEAREQLDEATFGCRPKHDATAPTEVAKLDPTKPPPATLAAVTFPATPAPPPAPIAVAAEVPKTTLSDTPQPAPERTLAAALPAAAPISRGLAPAETEAPAAPPPAPAVMPPRNVPAPELEALRVSGDKTPSLPAGAKMIARRDNVKRITVAVKVCVSDKGVPTQVTFVKSSDYTDANEKILSDIRKWRFRPYLYNGGPVPVCSATLLNYQII